MTDVFDIRPCWIFNGGIMESPAWKGLKNEALECHGRWLWYIMIVFMMTMMTMIMLIMLIVIMATSTFWTSMTRHAAWEHLGNFLTINIPNYQLSLCENHGTLRGWPILLWWVVHRLAHVGIVSNQEWNKTMKHQIGYYKPTMFFEHVIPLDE